MPLGKRTDCGDARFAGLEVGFSADVERTIEEAVECGFDFIVAPLADPARRPPPQAPLPDGSCLPRFLPHEVLHTMASAQLSNQIVGRVSGWIDPDAGDAALRHASALALREELGWAAHLTVQACLLPAPPRGARSVNYARMINHAVVSGVASMALWLLIPATTPPEPVRLSGQADAVARLENGDAGGGGGGGGGDDDEDPWEWWNAVRFACHHSTRLGVVLEVGPDLPPPADLARWWGEPLRALLLRTDAFSTNRRGFPALSRRHQELLSEAVGRGVQVVLSGPVCHAAPPPPPPPPDAEALAAAAGALVVSQHPMRVYWEYLSYLFRKREAGGAQDALEAPYRDYLQAPLQPLQDNLESATYETFERDATKYDVYGEAVRRALVDAAAAERAAGGGGGGDGVTVLMVVGAGRGPLVTASLRAGAASGRRLRVYAVEKNPNAVVHLHSRAAAERWGDAVRIVHADMREWRAPEPADILVSELLGSFGDNELSPECLDGAQRLLRPGGISIPAAYTSFLQPITSHKLWTDVKAYDDVEHFETPFVAKLFRYAPLAPPLPAFTFAHPNREAAVDNSREATLAFRCTPPGGTVCHGLAGYFEAQLYKDVYLSIHPDTHTPHMFSWFPIYFPLRTPFRVDPGTEVRVSMWRCATAHKVWYEWAVSSPQPSPIHNPDGRSYSVGL